MARYRAFLNLCAVLLALAGTITPAVAQSPGAPKLAGWWIAIDDVFPKLWNDGSIVPMEELLIIDDQLNFENRMMGFVGADPEFCSTGGPCSDAPLIATGRLVLAADAPGMVSIENYRATTNTLDHKNVDPLIRERAVSSTRTWRLAAQSERTEPVVLLRRQPDDAPRVFVKVEADRLRRLRAGFRMSELSAFRHWRCWIAAATDAGMQTPPFRPARLPSQIANYVRIASYRQTAESQFLRPMPDHPDPVQRKYADVKVEELLNERFDTLPEPATWQATRRPAFISRYIGLVSLGQTPDAARSTLRNHDPLFEPPTDISTDELAAARLVSGDTPEAKRLFCKP